MFSFTKLVLACAAVGAVTALPVYKRIPQAADASGAKPFTKSNGEAAIALNQQFAALKSGDACSTTAVQCAGDALAQCVGGAIVASPCAGGLVCRALPLVNSAGTSVTCDTAADADQRIANTGATAAAAPPADASAATPTTADADAAPALAPAAQADPASTQADSAPEQADPAPAPASGAKPFTLDNGKKAIALNAQFAAIKAGDVCSTTAVQCAGDQLAQCVGGAIVASPCAGGLVCRALPLVNSAGTSVTCDTVADAEQRITNTGAA